MHGISCCIDFATFFKAGHSASDSGIAVECNIGGVLLKQDAATCNSIVFPLLASNLKSRPLSPNEPVKQFLQLPH